MKISFSKITNAFYKSAFILLGVYALSSSCKKSDNKTTASSTNYTQVNLVADQGGSAGARIDATLINPWGIAVGPTGTFWISANGSGSTVVYDTYGAQSKAPITIPLGSPSGVVYNSTNGFKIPTLGKSSFIYATESGTIAAWNSTTGTTAVTVADRSGSGAVYKGLALASNGTANYIFATDFYNAKVDVYDTTFTLVTGPTFHDPNMPAGFAPFNIQVINNQLYVTYAKQKANKMDDTSGAGNGYIDVYNTAGDLVKRFASQGTLNSPWGITLAPTSFGTVDGTILVGNFGDGTINMFDATGTYLGQLKNNGNVISIQGLWALSLNTATSSDASLLYFTAGPGQEKHGLFGYLKKN